MSSRATLNAVKTCFDIVVIDIWTMDELISKVGSVDRSATLKALTTWVDLGVLKEVSPNTYRLLNVAEERSEEGPTAVQPSGSRSSIEDVPAVVTIQQQQAEQMQVFWKVCLVAKKKLMC